MYRKVFAIVLFLGMLAFTESRAQMQQELLQDQASPELFTQDSLPVTKKRTAKVEHAEPLFIDLIRDLGARKGEKEWNVGMGMTDRLRHDSYGFLVEYEWAVLDRLGLEIEVPATVYRTNRLMEDDAPRPSNRIESLKLASQYTFMVSEKWQTSLAIGGITEFELKDPRQLHMQRPLQGILYNPFFVAAKRWGGHFHSLVYTGPRFISHFGHKPVDYFYDLNTSVHYMIPGTDNFIGLEINKLQHKGHIETVIRPQMRVSLSETLILGIVPGIPVTKESERLSAFMRLIYEPHF